MIEPEVADTFMKWASTVIGTANGIVWTGLFIADRVLARRWARSREVPGTVVELESAKGSNRRSKPRPPTHSGSPGNAGEPCWVYLEYQHGSDTRTLRSGVTMRGTRIGDVLTVQIREDGPARLKTRLNHLWPFMLSGAALISWLVVIGAWNPALGDWVESTLDWLTAWMDEL